MTFFATDCAPPCPICESTCCAYRTQSNNGYTRTDEIVAECAGCKNVSFFSCPVDVDDAHGIRLAHERACTQSKPLREDWIDDARAEGRDAARTFHGYRSDVMARFVTRKRDAGMHEGDVRTLARAFREGFTGEDEDAPAHV